MRIQAGVGAGRWLSWVLTSVVLVSVWSGPAAAIEHQVSILLDADNDAATGCTIATSSGPFVGVEQVLVTTVDTVSLPADAATVTAVDRQVCGPGGVLGAPVAVDPGDWPVGISLGVDGFHVVETFLPLTALPADAQALRTALVVTDDGGAGSALLTTLPGAGKPIVIYLGSALDIPTVSEWGLLLLVLLLAGAAALRLRHLPATAALVVVLVLITGGVAWAACVLDGDPGEWMPGLLIAEDPPALCDGVSIRAAFAQQDAGRLCFRVDTCLRFNSAPVAQDQAVVTDEDTPVAIVLGATDPDGDPITGWSVVAPGPAHGSLTGVAPNLTYTPDPDYVGPDGFQFTASDGTATSDPATVSLTVTPVNDPPVVTPATFAVAEDAAVGTAVGTVAFADPDAGQSHTFSITAGNVGGAFAIAPATGEITVAAPLDFETLAAYSLTVEVTDDGAPVLSGSATVDITVTDVDDAPVAVDDAATVTEDDPATAVVVLANDTDTDGGPLAIQSVTQPANGTVVITGGGSGLTYAPDADYCNDPPGTTPDTFTYTLNGGSVGTVSMTVTCVDDAPVAVADAATVAEDSGANAIDVLANDTDVDGGAISVSAVTQPGNGTVVITGGGSGLTYAPDADYCNTPPGTTLDSFTYTLAPGGSVATVTVTVTCVDDAPVAVADAATVAEDSGANAIAVLANDTDVDGGAISVASVTQPGNGTVAITGGGTSVSYTPNANYCNDPPGSTLDSFTYTLTPGGSSTTVTVTVTCVDDPPTAVADSATVAEDSVNNPIDVLLNDADLDGGPRTVVAVQSPTTAGGTVVITGGGSGVAYTPATNYCNDPPGTTPDIFTYTLNGGSAATVSVTVSCVNDAPVVDLDADDDKGTAGTGFAVTFTENDPARLLVDPDDPLGAVISDVDSTALATLTVTLTNLLDAGEELLDADVSAFAPAITKDYDTTTPGVGVLTVSGPAPIADFVTVLRTLTYRHTGNDPDTTTRVVNVVANDGLDDSNTAVSTVTVVAVDDPPVAVADAATVVEDSGANAVDVLGNDTDVDGGPLSVQSVTQPGNGTVVITGGGTGVSYAPDANYCNDPPGTTLDTFTYTLNGGSVGTVTMTVTCVDDAPVAVADAATVVEDSGVNPVNVLANDSDVDGGAISIQSVTQPANGTVVITGGGTGLTYAPNANYCNNPPGTTLDTFTYTLNGGSVGTVTMTVTCVDDAPVAVADAATVVEDSGANAVDVLANDTDVDGGPISVQSVTQPANGTVAITGGGTGVSYTPNANYCNDPPGTTLDTFTYTLAPGGSSTTVTVTVTCVDDPPVAVNDSATVDEDSGANTIAVQANDTDVDGGVNTVTAVTQPANGTVAITNAGADVSYTPNANYCNLPPGTTPDTFTYTLSPGGSVGTVTVFVICINDPPVAGNDAFEFIGNTELRVDHGPAATPHAFEATSGGTGVLENDSDPVEGDPISIVGLTVGACVDNSAPFDCSDPAVGRVQIDADGSFSFQPAAGDTGATESFQYTLSDGTDTTVGDVTLTRFERVWYVKNDAAPGGDGTSDQPFDSITAANLSDNGSDGDLTDDFDQANDYIFVYFGDGTDSGHSAGLVLESGQHLIGEHAGLSLPVSLNGNGAPTVLVAAAPGNRPLLDDNVADGFDGVSARNVVPVEVVGMNLAGDVNALEWTTTGAFTGTGSFSIRDNVVRSAGGVGVDLNLAGTGATQLAFHDNSLTATGTALNIQETGSGTLTVTAFDDNTVNGNTGGSGMVISNAIFDATPGGVFNLVSGGTTVIGAPGNGVGGSGIVWNGISGDVFFTDLDVFADGGAGLSVAGTGASNLAGGTGLRFRVGAGVGMAVATGGPAVALSNLTGDVQLSTVTSTGSTTTGISLDGVTDGGGINAVFTAGSASSVTTAAGATGPTFRVNGGNARIAYPGTITNNSTAARAVSVTSWAGDDGTDDLVFSGAIDENGAGILVNGNSGSRAITFSGGLDVDTTTGEGFAATSNTNALGIQVTGSTNEIDSTSATALRVTGTRIGPAGLEFRRLSSGNATAAADPANGIVLSGTLSAGTDGGLRVTGTGSAGSGGTIQHTTGTGIVLGQTANVSLAWMQVSHTGSHGLSGAGLVDETGGGSPTLSVRDSRFTSPGDGDNESALFFGTTALPGNSTGRIVVADTIVEDFEESGFELANDAGTLAIEITGSLAGLTGGTTVFNDNDDVHGQHAVIVVSKGTAVTSLDVSGVYMNNIEAEAIMAQSAGTSSLDVDLIGNVSINGGGPDDFPSGGGLAVVQDAGAGATFDIQGNTIRDLRGDGVVIIADGPSSGRIGGPGAGEGNVISGTGAGDGIRIDTDQLPGGGDGFTATILIQNNQIGTDATFPGIFDDGIQVLHRDGNKTLNLTIEGNQIAGTGSEAIRIFTDADVSSGVGLPASSVRIVGNSFSNIGVSDATYFVTQDTAGMCLHLSGNSYSGTNRNISLNQQTSSVFQITQAGVAAVATDNPGSTVSSSGTITTGGTCTNPPLPNHS